MPPQERLEEIEEELEKNSELLEENNRLLRKLHRYHIISAWSKVIWIALIIGLPFAAYLYFIKPYFEALGASYETFQMGMGELPGLKEWHRLWEEGGTE